MPEANMLQSETYREVLRRLEELSPSSAPRWGEMDVAQMLAHLSANLELATGKEKIRQAFIGRIFGVMAKRQFMRKGVAKNIGTLTRLKIVDRREFRQEKENLQRVLERFYNGGEAGITQQPHEFFGRMTPAEWARMQYLHTDHHFRQFGV